MAYAPTYPESERISRARAELLPARASALPRVPGLTFRYHALLPVKGGYAVPGGDAAGVGADDPADERRARTVSRRPWHGGPR